MIKQYRFLIYMLLTGTLFLAGCGSSAVETSGSDTSTTTVNSSDESAAAIEEITATSSVTTSDLTTLFSDRDYEVGYEESDAVVLTLGTNGSGSGVEVAQGDASAVTIDGDVVTITEEGTYVLSGTLTDGAIIVNAPEAKVQIVLNGVDITSADQAAIYVADADKVFVTLAAGSKNSLANGGSFTAIDDNNVDAVIYSTSDLTMNGSGSLSVLSPGGHGIASKDELTVTGGTYEIEALNAGMKANDELAIADGSFTIHCSEGKGLKSETLVSVSDGTFTIVTDADDALHSDGAIMIAGGDFMISAGDDGMHADGVLSIGGGTIDITESYEGLEGLGIEIAGGEVSVVAKDDALNATNGADGDEFGFGFGGQEENLDADDASTDEESTDYSSYTAYVKISGGSLTVDAEGDGLDSNGTLEISGGDIIVYGPTMGGNGTLDYGSSATITGGTIIAFGPSSMEVNFTSDSTQGSILVLLDAQQQAGSTCEVKDADGNVIYSATAKKSYSSIIVSTPDITVGETYTICAGTSETEVTMDSVIYGEGSGMGMGGMGGMGPMQNGSDGSQMTPPDGGEGMTPPDGGEGMTPPDGGQMPQGGHKGGPMGGMQGTQQEQ